MKSHRRRSFSKTGRKHLMQLLFLLGVLLVLPLVVFMAVRTQNVQRGAAGTNEVSVLLNPSTQQVSPGASFSVDVIVAKSAGTTRNIAISGVESELTVSNSLTIQSVTCNETLFSGLQAEQINGQAIVLGCSVGAGSAPIALQAPEPQPVKVATITLMVAADAALGEAAVTFTRTLVVEAVTGGSPQDVSTAGEAATYTVGTGTTPGVSPSVQPTQIPTTCDEWKTKGDYNCDANHEVNMQDFDDWKADFQINKTILRFFEFWRRVFYGA